MIISYIGAGGKTTIIKNTAKRLLKEGKTVAITTTTHMYKEKDTVTGGVSDIIKCIREKGICMFGKEDGENKKKIIFPGYETADEVSKNVDYMLVEADGSKHMPAKFPRENEPVIYRGSHEIILIMSLDAIGGKIRDVVHGSKEACAQLNLTEDTVVDEAVFKEIIRQGYMKKISDIDRIIYTGRIKNDKNS